SYYVLSRTDAPTRRRKQSPSHGWLSDKLDPIVKSFAPFIVLAAYSRDVGWLESPIQRDRQRLSRSQFPHYRGNEAKEHVDEWSSHPAHSGQSFQCSDRFEPGGLGLHGFVCVRQGRWWRRWRWSRRWRWWPRRGIPWRRIRRLPSLSRPGLLLRLLRLLFPILPGRIRLRIRERLRERLRIRERLLKLLLPFHVRLHRPQHELRSGLR